MTKTEMLSRTPILMVLFMTLKAMKLLLNLAVITAQLKTLALLILKKKRHTTDCTLTKMATYTMLKETLSNTLMALWSAKRRQAKKIHLTMKLLSPMKMATPITQAECCFQRAIIRTMSTPPKTVALMTTMAKLLRRPTILTLCSTTPLETLLITTAT